MSKLFLQENPGQIPTGLPKNDEYFASNDRVFVGQPVNVVDVLTEFEFLLYANTTDRNQVVLVTVSFRLLVCHCFVFALFVSLLSIALFMLCRRSPTRSISLLC